VNVEVGAAPRLWLAAAPVLAASAADVLGGYLFGLAWLCAAFVLVRRLAPG
jgi:hypothetical protein